MELNENAILMLSVPYTKGWEITVDGKRVDSFATNLAFTGISLTAGKHQVELSYSTPGIYVGLALSMVGWGGFLLLLLRNRIKGHTQTSTYNELRYS